jgi:predicted ATP-grasp superfamily ATP-dependent carboligase
MIKIKIFESLCAIDLENKVNKFMEDNNIDSIVSINTEMNKFDDDENNMLVFLTYNDNKLLTE